MTEKSVVGSDDGPHHGVHVDKPPSKCPVKAGSFRGFGGRGWPIMPPWWNFSCSTSWLIWNGKRKDLHDWPHSEHKRSRGPQNPPDNCELSPAELHRDTVTPFIRSSNVGAAFSLNCLRDLSDAGVLSVRWLARPVVLNVGPPGGHTKLLRGQRRMTED
jgi:hypothetical protein